MKVVSLFTGAGGLDLGLEAAGFSTAVAVEFNSQACETLRANKNQKRNWAILEGDIHEISSQEILGAGHLKVGETTLLAGGPPCQPFSKSGYWSKGDSGRLNDSRSDTLDAYLRVLRDLEPKVFLLENVFGMAYRSKDEALKMLESTVYKINKEKRTKYSFCYKVLNCADYGVPQTRERLFIIGSRDGTEFIFPEPTHREQLNPNCELFSISPWRTAWDAIGDLENIIHTDLSVGGRWGDLLPSIPEGENYLFHTDRGNGRPLFGWRRRYWSFLLKLAKNRPSWTIQAQPGSAIGPFHWKNRKLSTLEMKRIQTFPDDYIITGGRTEVQRQIGNAVPSLMTEVLGREIRSQLLGDEFKGSLKLIPPKRTSTPPAELVQNVPKKYLDLEGEHTAHPGKGKGRSAIQWKNSVI